MKSVVPYDPDSHSCSLVDSKVTDNVTNVTFDYFKAEKGLTARECISAALI